MKHEVEMALRLLFRSDTSIPPDGRVDQAIEILKGHNAKERPSSGLIKPQIFFTSSDRR